MTEDARSRLQLEARITATPCGDGEMVWRAWGDGPPVVLLHGAHGSWTHWIRNIGLLAMSATVVVPDLPGHGDSALPAAPGDGLSHVRALSTGLRQLLGSEERYTLVGFSFGATIAIRLAAHDGGRVGSLVLVGLGGFGERARLPLESVRRVPDEAGREAAHRRNLEILMVADPRTIDAGTVRIQRDNISGTRIEPGDITWPTATPAAVRQLLQPPCVVYGDLDATIVPSAVQRREALLAFRPDADVRIIPAAGHWVQYEAPRPVEAIILERSGAG